MRVSNLFSPLTRAAAIGFALAAVSAGAETLPVKGPTEDVGAVPQATNDQAVADLMEQARQAMIGGDPGKAIQLYTKLLDSPNNKFSREALELLGLARERNGQLAQAKAAYEKYLILYPEGEDSERVKQRLAALVTAAWQPAQKMREIEAEKPKDNWTTYGSFYQYLRRDASTLEGQDEVVRNFLLSSNLDLNVRGKTSDYDVKARFSGGYFYGLDQASADQSQLGYFYVDINNRPHQWFTRIGRQTSYGGGVLGRFDGVNVGMRFAQRYTLNLVAGLPVERSTHVSPDTGRYFYGVNLLSGPWRDYWEFNGYLIEQRADAILDRRAVGGEVRYVHPQRSLYTLVDYDVLYKSLNIASAQGTWALADETTFSFMADYRNSPPIGTRNALFGQYNTSLKVLGDTYSEAQIRQLARDRTPHYSMAMVGVSRPLSDRFRLGGDFTVSDFSATPASAGVTANPGTPTEFYFSTRLTGSNLFKQGDANILGLRLAHTGSNDAAALSLSSRLPSAWEWIVNPRVQLEYRKYTDRDQTQLMVMPGLRFERYWSRRYYFELDTGLETWRQQDWIGNQNYLSYYLNIGYRVDF